MTDVEIEEEIQKLSLDIDRLSKAESLTKQEKRRKRILPLQEEILQRMKQAREKKDRSAELKYSMDYAVLTAFEDKHPILLHLARMKLRWNPF